MLIKRGLFLVLTFISMNFACSNSVVSAGEPSIKIGDTGYADHFRVIGDKYGPFDLTMIKIGAYGKDWPEFT